MSKIESSVVLEYTSHISEDAKNQQDEINISDTASYFYLEGYMKAVYDIENFIVKMLKEKYEFRRDI